MEKQVKILSDLINDNEYFKANLNSLESTEEKVAYAFGAGMSRGVFNEEAAKQFVKTYYGGL